jgi:hypothetical protein
MKLDSDEAASSSDEIDTNTVEAEKTDGPITHPEKTLPNNGAELPGVPYEELQHGIQEVEAVTQTWSKVSLILVFIK